MDSREQIEAVAKGLLVQDIRNDTLPACTWDDLSVSQQLKYQRDASELLGLLPSPPALPEAIKALKKEWRSQKEYFGASKNPKDKGFAAALGMVVSELEHLTFSSVVDAKDRRIPQTLANYIVELRGAADLDESAEEAYAAKVQRQIADYLEQKAVVITGQAIEDAKREGRREVIREIKETEDVGMTIMGIEEDFATDDFMIPGDKWQELLEELN